MRCRRGRDNGLWNRGGLAPGKKDAEEGGEGVGQTIHDLENGIWQQSVSRRSLARSSNKLTRTIDYTTARRTSMTCPREAFIRTQMQKKKWKPPNRWGKKLNSFFTFVQMLQPETERILYEIQSRRLVPSSPRSQYLSIKTDYVIILCCISSH